LFRRCSLIFSQLPVFASFFFGLQKMGEFVPAFSHGGALWFPDLAAADPTGTLPVLTGVTFLIMAEVSADASVTGGAWARLMLRVLSIAMVPLTYQTASGVFLYWLTSNACSIVQALVMKRPAVRAALDIPIVPERLKKEAAAASPM
ncbi:unnamed protein product, partial [Phaeothamnion confervicola]